MQNECWNAIGVQGDRSCPELKKVTHCRNCPVYTAAGRRLLERESPVNYRQEWTKLLAHTAYEIEDRQEFLPQLEPAPVQSAETIATVIFRLSEEWLALPAFAFKEVTNLSVIHTLPHRSNDILLGLVNIRGEILTCFSLSNLLGMETPGSDRQNSQRLSDSAIVYPRMVVVESQAEVWVFPVDEIDGIHRYCIKELEAVPAVVGKATETYTRAIINWKNKKVNYLNWESICASVKRRMA